MFTSDRQNACPSPVEEPGFFVLSRQTGFTTIELIVAIVIAGILAAVALPRWGGQTGFEERGLRDETVAALRYAQKAAIAARRTVCATFTASGISFRISSAAGAADCSAGIVLNGPQGDALQVAAKSGSQFDVFPASLIFLGSGQPAATTNQTVTVKDLATLPITVEAQTGYVH